jgi:hypothetical protein
MNQAQNGIRLAGIIAGTAAVCATLLCGCSQTGSTAVTTKTAVEAPAGNASMQEVVITASRQSAPPKG